MADEELELDVAPKKSNKTMIIVIVAIVLLNVIGVGAWLFLSGGDDSSGAEEKVDTSKLPLFYQTLTPEFVVNFGPGSKARYLQVELQIATRDQSALAVVATYKPVIRNDILILLSDVAFDDLNTLAGKEMLQKKILNTINRIVSEALHATPADGGKAESHAKNKDDSSHGDAEKSADGAHAEVIEMVEGPIENVYFASFIMQ